MANEKKFVQSARIKLENVVPGMALAEEIKNAAGGIVLAAGATLSRNDIEIISRMGVDKVYIEKVEVQKEHNALRGKKAVVIEDALFFRHMFAKMLYRMGIFVADDVETAEEGIVSAKKYSPDLLVVDVHLPGKSGIEVIKQVRKKLPCVKFLAVSSDKSRDNIINVVKAGADEFLLKPIRWEVFSARVMSLIARDDTMQRG